jgi:hypothetical protein
MGIMLTATRELLHALAECSLVARAVTHFVVVMVMA